tara:strand:- start:338 stop:976 length:639 start_codon:yes stop_codon:yes gene_type:complete
MKKCTKCKEEKTEIHSNFPRAKSFKSGFNSMCRSCLKVKQQEYRQRPENKKKHRETQAKWRKDNPEKQKEVSKKTYHKHKVKNNEIRRDKYKTDPEYRAKRFEWERLYVESGGRRASNEKESNRESSRKRNKKRRLNPKLNAHDRKRNKEWRKNNKNHLDKLHAKNRNEMGESYIAQTLGISVKDITPEILETKRLIISLKRELKSKNVKIR